MSKVHKSDDKMWQRRELTLEDTTGKMELTLWGESAEKDVTVGQEVKLKAVETCKNPRFNGGRLYLRSTDQTVIEVCLYKSLMFKRVMSINYNLIIV